MPPGTGETRSAVWQGCNRAAAIGFQSAAVGRRQSNPAICRHKQGEADQREIGGVWSRPFWLAVGSASLVLAIAGAVLPLLPATPFLLLAGFAFARSSPRLHRWLVTHRAFGPAIENWRRYRGITRRGKIAATITLAATFALSLAMALPGWVLALQAVTLAAVAAFILTRPTVPPDPHDGAD
jgi:uncharacterized membrane protein YbaN (DUF454 family)